MLNKYILTLFLISASTSTFAATSKDYALAGANAVTAAICLSNLANYPNEERLKEAERMDELLSIFQRDGHLFIEGVKGEKINREDTRKYVPIVLRDFFGLQISDDFYLGRVYQTLYSSTLNKLAEGLDAFSKNYAQELGYNASNAYANSNCALIK
ncbi:hypothetical protein [Cronobacter malonaticus]|uniref:hypothetical protein n=1 Tax=Cronobacter malonaticus TaxID=413503 RepID=UPI00131A4274|nr:hypothetical protein [Cronobacter malonaticus]